MQSAEFLDYQVRQKISRHFNKIAEAKAFRDSHGNGTTAYPPVVHEWVVIKNATTGEYRLQYNMNSNNLWGGWLVLDHPDNAPERFPEAQRVSLTHSPNPWSRV